jgi:hypothetical protein
MLERKKGKEIVRKTTCHAMDKITKSNGAIKHN